MSGQAQYTVIPRNSQVTIQTANAARDGTGALGVLATAPSNASNGRRIDRIQIQAGGTTTVNVIRLFITQGRVGATVNTITSVSTTASATTAVPHGMTTGDLVTMQFCFPSDYNVTGVSVTVTGASTFNYTMATTPTVASASTVGNYSTTPSTPVTRLWREILVPAIVPSTTVAAYSTTISTGSAPDSGYSPLVLEAGFSLRVSTNNAEVYYLTCGTAGDFA